MSLFEEKGKPRSNISSFELREALRKDSSDLGMKIGREDREKFAQELSKELGDDVSPEEIRGAIGRLREKESGAGTSGEKIRYSRLADLLKKQLE